MIKILKQHVSSLILLLLVLLTTIVLVSNLRQPGSMTVIESQAMDMHMDAPIGTFPVTAIAAKLQAFQASITSSATVTAWSEEKVVARVTGQIHQILVYPGDRVKAGQLLVELDSAELRSQQEQAQAATTEAQLREAAAQQDILAAQAGLSLTRRESQSSTLQLQQANSAAKAAKMALQYKLGELSRDEALYKQGALSLEELQRSRKEASENDSAARIKQLEVKRVQKQIQVNQMQTLTARSRLQQSEDLRKASTANTAIRQAQQNTAAIITDYTKLRSHQSAQVVERLVSPGTLVEAGTTILRLQQTDKVRLQARIAQEDARWIQPGNTVQVRRPGLPTVQARVSANFQSADPVTRTVTIEATLPNLSGHQAFHAGEFVSMEVALGATQKLVTLPARAIQHDLSQQAYVWLIQQDQDKHAAPIYTCVMHPEIRSSQPGTCPKCGMDLVLQDKSGKLTVHRQPVKLAGQSGEWAGISSGLKAGQQVVLEGGESLQEGSPISLEQDQP